MKFMSEIKNTEQKIEKIFKEAQDFLPLLGTDYVEFYVGKTINYYFKTALVSIIWPTRGETGSKDVTLCVDSG